MRTIAIRAVRGGVLEIGTLTPHGDACRQEAYPHDRLNDRVILYIVKAYDHNGDHDLYIYMFYMA